MYDVCMAAAGRLRDLLPAVADWHVVNGGQQKIKKTVKGTPQLALAENPDILASLGQHENRPALVIGFAAETENLAQYALPSGRTKNVTG